ncbi:MAG: phosphatidylglycerophosphatase A [Campylobacteraceae bacterium]|jgi:phosphatidylglycerophosphatase A|nr:phosphatidylglycerophosphatase A [Campylobacteraceae bacterium]
MQKVFLTFFYSGLCPKAPGTAGTIAGAILGWAVLKILPISTLFLLTVLISVIAIGVINRYESATNTHDNSQIVIDEVVGVWLAMCISADFLASMGAQVGMVQVLICIVFFRVFDILKPSIIGRIDRDVKGGAGVVGDDLVAGLFAGIISAALWNLIRQFEIVQNYNF